MVSLVLGLVPFDRVKRVSTVSWFGGFGLVSRISGFHRVGTCDRVFRVGGIDALGFVGLVGDVLQEEAGRSLLERPDLAAVDRYAPFFHTETCLVLSLVKGSRFQPLQRSLRVIPARRAIKSSSDGHT